MTPAFIPLGCLLLLACAQPAKASGAVNFPVCYDYGCKTRETVTLSDYRWQIVARQFDPPPLSPADERRRIAGAIGLLEILVGERTPTQADLGGNARGAGLHGQMDCIDESTNTSTYLDLLWRAGLLRWHEPLPRRRRSKWLVDNHWSAAIRDLQSGQAWVVDSWFADNGLPPDIRPMDDWLARRGDPSY